MNFFMNTANSFPICDDDYKRQKMRPWRSIDLPLLLLQVENERRPRRIIQRLAEYSSQTSQLESSINDYQVHAEGGWHECD